MATNLECSLKASGGAKGGGGVTGRPFTGAAISICKSISTIPIGAPLYICLRAAIPFAPPLLKAKLYLKLRNLFVITTHDVKLPSKQQKHLLEKDRLRSNRY